MSIFEGSYRTPGVTAKKELAEWQGWYGKEELQRFWGNKRISGAARDAGNTPTTVLRGGLVMGLITATQMFKEWNPAGTDGSQYACGILTRDLATQENGADSNSLVARVMQAGLVHARDILIPGEATYGLSGKDLEFAVRNALSHSFSFDDLVAATYPPKRRTIIANTTLTSLDHGALIDNIGASGSVTITLPTPKKDLIFEFLQRAGQDIVLNSAASNEFVPSSGTPADSYTLAGALHQRVRVIGTTTALYFVERLTDTDT